MRPIVRFILSALCLHAEYEVPDIIVFFVLFGTARMQQGPAQRIYLADLTLQPMKTAVCVRVIRKWVFDGNQPGGAIWYIGLVLANEKVRTYLYMYNSCMHTPHSRFHCSYSTFMLPYLCISDILLHLLCREIPFMPRFSKRRSTN